METWPKVELRPHPATERVRLESLRLKVRAPVPYPTVLIDPKAEALDGQPLSRLGLPMTASTCARESRNCRAMAAGCTPAS